MNFNSKDINELINFFPDPVIVIDINLNVVLINDKAKKLFSINVNENLNNKLSCYIDQEGEIPFDYNQCILKNDVFSNLIYLNMNDTLMPVFLSIKKNQTDAGNYFLMTFVDINKTSECVEFLKQKKHYQENGFFNIIGKDKKMTELFNLIKLSSESDANILIMGESGTGKELIAKAIHNLSNRKDKPFITVNCSSLSENLLESELFGHVKGSFTGAYKDKIGKFEASHEGTIFLDEIGDISPLIQLKLLRVIQEKVIEKVGDNKEIKVDMRIIAATNKNLRELVSKGNFREDLYYRLKVFAINSVPLREHKSDIPLLCAHFIKEFNLKTGKKISGLKENSLRLLMDYCWPGNVRELENAIEHAFVVCAGNYIDIFDLPNELRVVAFRDGICKEKDSNLNENSILTFFDNNAIIKTKARNIVTKERLMELLAQNNNNKSETARQLGISRIALWKKIKKFNMEI